VEEGRVHTRRLADELREHRSDRPEHRCDLLRLHERLEVVEEGRVRRVRPLEAFDVAPLEVEIALECRQEPGEVARRPGLDPHLVPERGRADHLRAELGRHPPFLLPVPARHADEARVVGVVLEGLLEWSQELEQPSDLVVDEPFVGDPADGRHRLCAGRMAAGRHRHLLIPREHA
jgi:hypothetical protein